MRILLDECVNPRLKSAFPGHEVKTVPEMGWQGLMNGELLVLAEAQFDVFVTLDKNLEFQQNLSRLRLGVLVALVPDNKMSSYQPILARLKEAAETVQPGRVIRVAVP